MIELMLPPFVACMILVAIHSYLGLHVIAREVIFVDLSLAQMAALGTTTGILAGVAPESQLAHLFALLAAAYAVLGALLFLGRRRFETISFEPQTAEREGWNVRWWDFLFYAVFGTVITFSVPIGGVLMVFSFLVVPAVSAFLFTRRPGLLAVVSWATGAVASAAGLVVSYHYDLPTGPMVVCSFGLVLVFAALVRRFVVPTPPTEPLHAAGPAAGAVSGAPTR